MAWWRGDIVTGRDTYEKVPKIKTEATEMFSEGGLKLHKWHWNDSSPETASIEIDNTINYVKEPGTWNQTKWNSIFGLALNKVSDSVSVKVPQFIYKSKQYKYDSGINKNHITNINISLWSFEIYINGVTFRKVSLQWFLWSENIMAWRDP